MSTVLMNLMNKTMTMTMTMTMKKGCQAAEPPRYNVAISYPSTVRGRSAQFPA